METTSSSTALPLIAREMKKREEFRSQKHPACAGIKAFKVLLQTRNPCACTRLFLAGMAAVKTVNRHPADKKKTPS